ncbi:MAG: HD domain-containing phosphohydrolase, partial [Huintestinicola sp.]
IRLISTASSLHDIGKIAIPDEILNKPGRFTPEEYEIMKTHSEIGASMLKNLSEYQNEPLMKASYEICRWHHERYDGRGYPDGLKGDEIPISAQIVSIADVYDALTSERCYKKAYTHEKAIEMICGGECGVFNPLIIECLLDISGELEKVLNASSSGIRNTRGIGEVADEILNNKDLSSSGQMIQQLELERERADFFEEELGGITFTYQSNPPVLTLSESGAEQLGISRIISEPHENPDVKKISDESLKQLMEGISRATSAEPYVTVRGHINAGGQLWECEYRCRTLWMASEKAVYIGTAGKVILLEESKNKEGVSAKETDGMDFSMLKSIGINTENAVERFMGNEALYVKMLKKFLDDKTYSALTAAVSENSRQAALEASHTLKGICGNLSFEKMFALFSEQVVLMRADKWDEAYGMMTEIAEQYDTLTETLRTWIDMQ